MAGKVNTNDPKHHKYVSVNKRERKKRPKRVIRLLSLLFPRWMHSVIEKGFCWNVYSYRADNLPGTKVIYDDCNHRSYRKMIKTKDGWRVVGNDVYDLYYMGSRRGYVRRMKKHTFRQSNDNYEQSVKHFKR